MSSGWGCEGLGHARQSRGNKTLRVAFASNLDGPHKGKFYKRKFEAKENQEGAVGKPFSKMKA